MRVLNRLHVLNADQIADCTRLHDLTQCLKIGRIAQNVAHGDNAVVFFCLCEDGLALLLRLCHRLFEQYVVTHGKCSHARLVVQEIGSGYNDGIGELFARKDLVEIAEAVLFRYFVSFGNRIAAQRVDVRYADDLHRIGIRSGIAGISLTATAGTDYDNRYRSGNVGTQRFDGNIYLRRLGCRIARRCG